MTAADRRALVLERLARDHRRRAAREVGARARALLDAARELESEVDRLRGRLVGA